MSTLFGITFASPWLLFWAVAVSIPVLIHLWNRHKYEELDWAAMRFLMQAVKQNSRRITLEQLLLLGLRCLILLLLALAIASPFLARKSNQAAEILADSATHYVLMIDGSYSMDYRLGQETAYQLAKHSIAELVDGAQSGDAFTLIQMAQPAEVIIAEPAFQKQMVKQEIDNLTMTHAGADLESALAEVESLLRQAQETHPEFVATNVVFFTDLGETTWAAAQSESIKRRVGRIAELAQIEVREISTGQRENNTIVGVSQNPPRLILGEQGDLSIEIRNSGSLADQQTTVELTVDGQSLNSKTVNIAANESASVSFPITFQIPDDHSIVASITADQLPLDDTWYSSVPVRSSIRVLCVEGRPGESENIKWALQGEEEFTATVDSRVEVVQIPTGGLLEHDLNSFDCVALCNISGFQETEAKQLFQFVQGGGGLLIFAGDNLLLDNYNRMFYENSDSRLIPGRLTGLSPYQNHDLNPLDYRHPIVEPFRGVERAGLLTTPIWKYVRLAPAENSTATTALAFQNGDPVIIDQPLGFGHAIFFSSAINGNSVDRSTGEVLPWTEFHTWPSYVVLINEMLLQAVSGNAQKQNLVVGDLLQGTWQGGMRSVELEMTAPDDRELEMSIRRSEQSLVWNAGVAETQGLYKLKMRGKPDLLHLYSANLATAESNVSQLTIDMLPVQFQEKQVAIEHAEQASSTNRQRLLFQYLLLGLLGLVILESSLAWYFGRQR